MNRNRIALLPLLALALTLVGAPSALAITRESVALRAQSWVDRPVRYSQARHHLGYRTDCSGYVSMCWSTGFSWSTRTFSKVTRRIGVADLRPGDAMLKKGYHIRLFEGWTDETHTAYVAYEAGSGTVAIVRVHGIADDLAAGYVPVRYKKISDGGLPANVLRNRSFDAWPSWWDSSSRGPIWWQVDGPEADGWWWQPLASRRTDVRHIGLNAIELRNPSDDARVFASLSQTATIAPVALYRLSAWAKTASDPSAVELSVQFLDASGASIAETSTTGDACGLNAAAFAPMSLATTAPAEATTARVAVRLAGGTAAGVPGTAVTLDDISLERPAIVASIRASKSTVRGRGRVVLSGSVWPAPASPVSATVWVRRPGTGWRRLSAPTVVPSATSGSWATSFAFKRGMRKGAYEFRASVPGYSGYLGAGTSSVKVRLK